MEFGIENRALQYLVLDPLMALADLDPSQYALRGGVKAAIKDVADAMKSGPVCAIEVDIKDCYSSFDGKKLQSLIPLPKEVTQRVITSKYLHLIGGNAHDLFGPADGEEWEPILLNDVLADARRGIPQGSAVSPLVTEMVLAASLKQIPILGSVFAYADNTLLMAKNESDAVSMSKALWSALDAHPVGRLRPKFKAFGAGQPIDFLGLRGIEWAIFDAEGLTNPRITLGFCITAGRRIWHHC
jgi:hypothetical protein